MLPLLSTSAPLPKVKVPSSFTTTLVAGSRPVVFTAREKISWLWLAVRSTPAALGLNLAAVDDGGVDTQFALQNLLGDTYTEQAAVIEREHRLFTGGESDVAEGGGDVSVVFHLFAEQGDVAAEGGVDGAAVDYRAVGAGHLVKDVIPVHEIGGVDGQPRGNEAADVEDRGRGEEDAVGVDEYYLAVGVDTAGDGGAVVA